MKAMRLTVSSKISIICGIIIFIILSVNMAIFNRISSNLVSI